MKIYRGNGVFVFNICSFWFTTTPVKAYKSKRQLNTNKIILFGRAFNWRIVK